MRGFRVFSYFNIELHNALIDNIQGYINMVWIDTAYIDLEHDTALLSLREVSTTKQSRPDVPKSNGIAAPEGSR